MNIAIVIPARLNSTRLKEKMLMMFDGEPLIRLVFDKCVTMGLDCFVVTDSKKIAKVAKKYGAEIPFLRSKKLSNNF